eukprot:gene6861-7075_t
MAWFCFTQEPLVAMGLQHMINQGNVRYTYKLLAYMHEVPDLDCKAGNGIRRLDRYDQLAGYLLGKRKGKLVLLPFQLAVLVGIGITYTVVAGSMLQAFAMTSSGGTRHLGTFVYMIIFGAVQIVLAMLPSFDDIRLVSLLGSVMSMAYCLIAFIMSATVKPGPATNYNPAAVERSTVDKVMGIFNALTSILFAYGGHNVALEIQATIPSGGKHPASTIPAMMKGVNITFLVTGICYFCVSISGFHAFGTSVPDNVLSAFVHGDQTRWVVAAANLMVVIHVAAAYQVITMPVYSLIETGIKHIRGKDDRLPLLIQFGVRFCYVVAVTAVAVVVPFFGALMGLIGAIAVTPTTFLLPPLFWLMLKKPSKWGLEWTINWFLVWVTGLLGMLGVVGSLYIIITAWSSFKIFAN